MDFRHQLERDAGPLHQDADLGGGNVSGGGISGVHEGPRPHPADPWHPVIQMRWFWSGPSSPR